MIAQYTKNAPDTDGYGIYLVFWSGRQHTQAPPSGNRPADTEELKERLEAMLAPSQPVASEALHKVPILSDHGA